MVGSCFAASLIGMESLGLGQQPQNAALIRNGSFSENSAINAFENRTKFGTTIQFENTEAQKGESSVYLNSFTVPSISMVLPLGSFGVFGINLEQKYFSNNRLELIDSSLDANVLLLSRTGIYELSPSYSIRLPFFLRDFAIGASYRVFFGNAYSSLERYKSKSWSEDEWRAKNVLITEKETAEFESSDDWNRMFGVSLHFHRKTVDYFVSYFPSVQMKKIVTNNVQFSNEDTLQSNKRTDSFRLPKRFNSGVNFRFWQNQNISLSYELQNFKDSNLDTENEKVQNSKTYFLEYKISGTGLYYSPFFKRNNFGLNAWYREQYIKDINEYGASVFSDLSLGRKGTIIGIALFGGYRDAEEPNWSELFMGFKLSLTGVGTWGTSARRR